MTRWVVFVVLPLLLALYLSYPPGGITVENLRVENKVARTADEAKAHNVDVGKPYVVKKQVLLHRWLPLASVPM